MSGPHAAEANLDDSFVNMCDRLATVGGELKLSWNDGHGTPISGRVPLPTRRATQPPAARRAKAASLARPSDHESVG